jgi:cellulose synthase operon protein C
MAFPKIKLCWKPAAIEADWHLGLFGTYARGGGTSRLRGWVVSLRGLSIWLGALAFAAYFSGAAALWFWLDRRPYNYVGYTDLILPTRWSNIEKLRGRALIAEAKDDLNARKWGAGIQKMRIGIARYPEEREGRLMLAEMFTAMKARKQAIDIYNGGLDHGYPGRDYIEAMLKSAMQSEDYDWALDTCDRALALVDAGTQAADRRWLIERKLAALLSAGRPQDALALAEKEGESWNPSICEFRVLALLQAGDRGGALAFLTDWSKRTGGKQDPQILRLQVRAYREAGNIRDMENALEDLRKLSPIDPRPYVYGIVQRLLAGEKGDTGYENYLLRFGSQPQHLLLLAAPLAEIGNRDMIESLIAYAGQQGFSQVPLRRYLLQVLMEKGEWRQAEALLADMNGAGEKPAEVTWYEITNARIQAALDPADGAQSNLVSLVRGRMFTLSFYKDLITAMRSAGRPATARELITFAQGVYPRNQEIETWRKELDRELTAAEAAKPEIVLRKTEVTEPTEVVPVPARVELDEKNATVRLAELGKAGDFEGALSLIREVRAAKPAWLAGRAAEWDREEIRYYGRAGDRLGLRSAARRYITGDRLRSAQMIEIARELKAAGQPDEAVFLLRELLAKVPDYDVAKKLVAEWSPAPEKTAH